MNTKLALTAILMFAVIMGISVVSPAALAERNGSNGQKTTLCHFQEEVLDADGNVIEEEHVAIITINDRALDTHLSHGDWIINNDDGNPDNDSDDCPVTLDEE